MLATSLLAAFLAGPSIGPEASPDMCQRLIRDHMGWLVGEWAVVRDETYVAYGEVHLTTVWGGCAILEQQTGHPAAQWPLGDGVGLIRFDPVAAVWRYSFTGDGVAMEAEGPAVEGRTLSLDGTLIYLTGGSQVPARIHWSAEAEGVRHVIETLDRDTGQYTPWQVDQLRPAHTTPRPREPDHWNEP